VASNPETLCVIIPCLNEEASIDAVVSEVLEHAPRLPMELRVLLIDDGSTDGTRARMEAICERDSHCALVVNERNIGMGASVFGAYEGLQDGTWVTVLPGDGEVVFPSSIDNFMPLRDRHEVILGYLQNPVIRTIGRRLASYAFTRVTAMLYGFRWTYLNGLKLYRVEAFRGLEVKSGGHAYFAEMLAKAQLRRPSLRITEAPFVARGRPFGSSKAMTFRSVFRALHEVWSGARAVGAYRRDVVRSGAFERR
jgi:glycosyltransferase involved in cell wall biosynthesis